MESVQMRWKDSILEYRSLIILESETELSHGGWSISLRISDERPHTEWAPVPQHHKLPNDEE